MVNPKIIVNFTTFFFKEEYIKFTHDLKTKPIYKILPNLTYFLFFSTKFNKWTITYKSKNLTKYVIGNPIAFNKWEYLNQNEQFIEFHHDMKDLLMFNNLFDSINYLKPNLNIKPTQLYNYDELEIRQKQHWNKT